ncbi:MAG: AAA family ATPase [Coleofasciculaceae cyanobacterium SM2_1_6]|nr:AAA family ATPase [Coleofasciculaceae cyanobacterium SM2_1_6]
MKTISVISQKGGAGKTTLGLHLGVAATYAKKSVAIIDLDPQASAATWGDSRENDRPSVVSTQSSRLDKVLEAAKTAGADLVVIDTAPHSESSSLAAARAADLILIPCRPSILDIRAIGITIDLAKLAGKPAVIVFNSVPPRGSILSEAKTAVQSYGVEVCPVSIVQRATFSHALTGGLTAQEYEPNSKAALEIKQLYKWICKHVGM